MIDIGTSRHVRMVLLDALWNAAGAGTGLGFTWLQLKGAFRSQLEISESDLRRELNDLVNDDLVVREDDEVLNEKIYRITSRGSDFKKCGCPWERVDEFTGKRQA